MKTNSMKMINKFIRRGGGANLNLFRYAAMVFVLLLAVGNAWGGNSYYTAFSVTSNDTGKGLVYTPSTVNTTTAPTNDNQYGASGAVGQSDDTGGSDKTNPYYAWAKAARGYAFDRWTVSASSSSGGVSVDDATKAAGAKITVTSNVKDGTNTGTATAEWKTDPNAYTVTFGVPVDGSYTVSYSYTTIENNAFTTGGFNFSMTESSTAASGQQTSYAGDVVTVSSDASNFDGWYSNNDWAENHKLSGATSYQFTVSGATSVYAKFKEASKYYGQVNASIADVPYSMPGGGKIYISTLAGTSGATFSEDAQTIKFTSFNSDATPPASVNQTYYLYAQPTDKRYVFRGWYDNATCTGTPLSTSASWEYSFAVNSRTEGSPTTKTVYAAFDFNLYYLEVQAQPATPGLGMVLVSDTKLTSLEYTQYSSESSQFAYAYRLAPTTDVYVYAKPKYGYKLSGWYTDAACTIAATVASDGKYTASSTASTDPLNPDTIALYAKFVEESKVSITYNLPDKSKGEYVAFALDIEEIDDEFVWTRTELYNSNNYTANTTLSQYKTDVLILDAEPKSGYGVTAWSDNGTSKSSLSHIYQTDATSAKSFGVTFGEAKPFLVSRNSTYYSDLQEAITATNGSGRITVVQNAYVPAGTYTIPSGVTLVVPFDANGSNYTSLSSTYTVHASWSQPSCYSKLTLASGCTINVNSNAVINVAAKEFEPDGGNKGVGAVATAYGQIDMEAGSAINVHSGGKLYCWGYITGDGMVTIENGAAVTEMLQTVSRGGTAFSSFSESSEGDHCFPLNQYYIQNIEAYLRVNYGATETVWTSLYIRGDKITSGTFIGSNGSGFFELSSGSYLIRKYDPTTDRINYDIYGSAKLSHLSITIYINIDTKNYTMPITNNMTINCHAIGDTPATITVSYRMALLPSAVLSIDKNVTVDVSKKLYVYDRDEWVGKSFSYLGTDVTPICYSPTKTKTRASADLVDAKIVVNGTLKCSGEVYTTSSGAKICSSSNDGTGIVHFAAAAGTDANTYQAVQSSSSISTPAIPMTSAKLQNGDGSYVTTVGSAAGSKFYYSKSNEKWMKDPKTISWNANGGETADATTVYSDGSFLGELPAAYKEGHTFAGWWTAASGGTQITQTTKVTANETYYAHWTPIQYNITYMDQGKAAFSGTHIDSPNAHPTKHTYGTTTTLNGANNKTGYDFGGWHTISNCKESSKVTSLSGDAFAKDITLYAKWTPQEYTITYKDKDNAEFSGTSWASTQPTTHTYGTATTLVSPSKENYVFDGWFTSADCSGSAVTTIGATDFSGDFTLYAKWTPAVASVTIGVTTYYKTIADAFAAANSAASASTIKVLQDATVASAGVTYSGSQNCTLDLNGQTISCTSAGARLLIISCVGATFTITDNTEDKLGKLLLTTSNTTGAPAFCVQVSQGTLQLEAGTVYLYSTSTNRNAVAVRVDGGNFIMNGGTAQIEVTQSGRSGYAMQSLGSAVVTVNGGTAITKADNGYAYGTYVTGTMTVYGGKFHLTGQTASVVNPSGSDSKLQIKGGYYNTNAGLAAKCATNYHVLATTAAEKAEVGNEYNYKVAEAYTVRFNNYDGTQLQSSLKEAGVIPSYDGETPAKPTTDEYRYTFTGWSPELTAVTANATYTAQFEEEARPYTITWLNCNGEELHSSISYWDETPAYPTYLGTPTYTDAENHIYRFTGWDPAVHEVNGLDNNVYTATYERVDNLEVAENETIEMNATVTTTTVRVEGNLEIAEDVTLTTDDLILEGTPTTSGEITGRGRMSASNAYFHFKQDGGFKAKTWYAVAVPWEVDAETGVSVNGNTMTLGRDFDLIYYDGDRRAQGATKAWNYVEDDNDKIMHPGRAYMIYLAANAPTIRFKRAGNAELHNTSVTVNTYTGNDAQLNNWNGIANPALYHAYVNAGADDAQHGLNYGQVYDAETKSYKPLDMAANKLVVGQPIFVQAAEAKTFDVSRTEYASSLAPRRVQAAKPVHHEVSLISATTGKSDMIVVRMNEDKEENAYTVGQDLAKMGVSSVVPQLWIDRYDSRLCIHTAIPSGNEAEYPLSLYAPQAGEYQIAIHNSAMSNQQSDMLYLTYDGRAIWNLTYAPYTLSLDKETNTHYGLRVVASPAVATGMDEATIRNGNAVRKVLIDDQVFIIRNGEIYSTDGRLIK